MLLQALAIILLINSASIRTSESTNGQCKYNATTDLTNAFYDEARQIYIKDNLTYESGDYLKSGNTVWGCVCQITTCVSTCCPPGHYVAVHEEEDEEECLPHNKSTVIDIYHGLKLMRKASDYYQVEISDTFLGYTLESTDDYYIQNDGTLIFMGRRYSFSDYCMEYHLINGVAKPSMYLCFIDKVRNKPERVVTGTNIPSSLRTSESTNGQCKYNETIDLTNAFYDEARQIFIKDNLTYESGDYIISDNTVWGCVCQITTCVSTCCPPGNHVAVQEVEEGVEPEEECVPHNKSTKIDIYQGHKLMRKASDYYQVEIIDTCSGYKLESTDDYYIQNDGTLIFMERYYSFSDYCREYYLINGVATPSMFVCFIDKVRNENERVFLMCTGMFISIPFLFATFIVYAILPDRNLPGKCLMGFVLSLMCSYTFLIAIQLNDLSDMWCDVLGGVCLFSFMSTFCWMNVSCIDIYMTFSGRRGFRNGSRKSQRQRFLLYCLYTIGFPLMLVAVMLAINYSSIDVAKWYHPKFGHSQCWVGSNHAKLLYFYGPLGILLSINIVLFALTAWKIRETRLAARQFKGESQKHYNESDKQRFNLYLKLLFVMGINWSLEFISWLVDWLSGNKYPQVWYVTDLCNALYGVLIFFIFVCKRNIWIALQKRYYIFRGQPQKANALSSRASQSNQMSKTENTIVDETTLNDT